MLPEWLSRALEPYSGTARDGRTLDELAGELPPELVDRLRRLGLLVLRPDSLVTGEAPAVLEALETEDRIVPVDLRVLWLGPSLFDAIYRRKLRSFGENLSLHHEILEQAPAGAVLVTGAADGAASLSDRLDVLKGPSSPRERPGERHLRGRFGRLSALHAVVHAAEDPGALLHEATLLFPWPRLVRALEGVADPSPIPAELRQALLRWTAGPTATVFEVVLSVKLRLLASCRLSIDRGAAEAGCASLVALWRSTAAARERITGRTYAEAAAVFGEFVGTERGQLAESIAELEEGPVRDLPAAVDALRLLDATRHLSGDHAYVVDDGAAIFDLLDAHDVPLSPWEKTLVRSGLRADLNPAVLWNRG